MWESTIKILEISCHEVLERDTVNIITDLGHDISSNAFFLIPNEPYTKIRPPTKNKADFIFINQFKALNPFFELPSMVPNSGICRLSLEMLDRFDVVIIDYYPWIFTVNEDVLKRTKASIILRTIGFGCELQEEYYAHAKKYRPDLKIVRMHERERICQNYAGEDYVITQCFDPSEYLEWNGNKKQILTINKMFKKRADSCNFWTYMEVMEEFEKEKYLVGIENEDIKFAHNLSFDQLRQTLSDSRVYFSTSSKPASCVTLGFIEAFCTGIPIVSISNGLGSYNGLPTFMIDKYIENGINGFHSDNIEELQRYLRKLLDDHELAKKVGQKGRETGLKLFHRDIIKEQWRRVFSEIA